MSPTTLQDPRAVAIAARLGATPAQVLLAWQLRVGVSLNPRSISAQHMQDGLEALSLAPQLTGEELAVLGAGPQIWCSVMPSNYQCAPDPGPDHRGPGNTTLLVGSPPAAGNSSGGGGGGGGEDIASGTDVAWAPSPKCQAEADKYCEKCFSALKSRPCDGPMVARHSSNEQHEPDTWRCYSPSTLTPDRKSYAHGNCYCTKDAPIRSVLKACGDPDPDPPPPPPPPPLRPGAAPCKECVAVFYAGLNQSKCFRIPTILMSSKGTLLAFAENRITDCGDNGLHHDLVLRRSSDHGRTCECCCLLSLFSCLSSI
jgi:hypothetical protein